MAKIRILVADDHAIVRAGIRLILDSQTDMEVIGEAQDGKEAIARVRELQPDIVLMDITMPGINGIEATRHIRRESPSSQVIALTIHENEAYFYQILQAGALGYVLKGATPSDLISAIRAVRQGQAYLQPSLAKNLLDDYLNRVKEGKGRDKYNILSEREREILRQLAEGKTGKEIAELLCISPYTVERHRANILTKLGFHNRTQLIKYAIRKGLIEVEG